MAICLVLLLLALRILAHVRGVSMDVFHEMALFREILALGGMPREDVFAYTSTVSPSVHHEWGTGAFLYLVTVTMGLGLHGLAALRFLLLGVVVACCLTVARMRGATGVEVAVCAPLAIVLFWPGLSPVRAHMFTFALLALLLYFLEIDRRGSRWWLLLWPLLFVLWLNLHGGFVVGAGMLGLYTVETFLRKGVRIGWTAAARDSVHLFAATGVTLPLVLVNPYGPDYVGYLWHALLLDRPLMTEWAPLWASRFRSVPLPLFVASLLLAAYTLARGKEWFVRPGLLLLLAAAFFAAGSIRFLPLYVVVWISYVPAALAATPLAGLLQGHWRRHARRIAVAALAVGAVGLWQTTNLNPFVVLVPTHPTEADLPYPSGAVQYLEDAEFSGNLMTPFQLGAFVSWYLYPAVKVGMDSRYEVAFAPELAEETIRIYRGEGNWREFLSRHPTDAVLVPATSPLDSLLTHAAGGGASPWQEVYRDDAHAIFAHFELAGTLPVIDRRGEVIPARFP